MNTDSIKKTKDYDKFKVFTYNRPINQGLVKSLIASMEKIGYIIGKPVLVDKDFHIIDGQHRFTACVKLGIPVPYIMTSADAQTAMVSLNSRQAQWNNSNYVHMWAESGIKCYQHLLDFSARRELATALSMEILFKDDLSSERIKGGFRFSINDNAEKIADFIKKCEMVPYNKTHHFVRAVVKIWTRTTGPQKEKILKYLISVPQQAKQADYLMAFENIINKGVNAKNRISLKVK